LSLHRPRGRETGVFYFATHLNDRSGGSATEEVKPFTPTIDLVIPNGPCFSKDGFLFVVEQNRVLM